MLPNRQLKRCWNSPSPFTVHAWKIVKQKTDELQLNIASLCEVIKMSFKFEINDDLSFNPSDEFSHLIHQHFAKPHT